MIKLSVITVNFKAWVPLERCLNSLMALQPKKFSLEVVVVDNFSNDGRLDEFIEKFPSFKFIQSDGNYGFSHGNNLGAKHATGDFLMFLNSDTVVSLEPMQSMMNLAQQNSQYTIVSSQQVDLNGNNENPFGIFPSFWTINSIVKSIYSIFSGEKFNVSCNDAKVIFPEWVSGSLVLISRSNFDKLNGWDEDYWLYSEDADLCKRAKDMGGTIAMQCSPSITHQHAGTTRRTLRLTAFYKAMVIIAKHIYFKKHFSGAHLFILQFFLVINTLILDNLIPALIGLIFFPIRSLRKYLFIYFNMLKYYINAIKSSSWFIDIKKVKLPE